MNHILVQSLTLGGDGPRVALKDCIDIDGIPTRCGSRALANAPAATSNAVVVDRLLSSGARIVGKANMHEFAYGVTGMNGWTGTPPNPRYPGRIPGGSSSGSAAAVAAGLADIGIGTDTGGSIRMPAACCGIFGLKPTFGLVSRVGVSPRASSLDCVGPMAANMAGIAQAMAFLVPDFQPQPAPSVLRLGLVTVDADPEVHRAVADALAQAGVELRTVTLPGFTDAFDAGMKIIAREAFAAFGCYANSRLLGEDVRDRLQAARLVSDDDIRRAERTRERFGKEVDEALSGVQALVLPTLPVVPPLLSEVGDGETVRRLTALVRPFNLSGHPALTIPIETQAGLPAGLQLVGARDADACLCAVGAALADRIHIPSWEIH